MSKKQILVVDDSFIMRTIIKDIVDSDPELEVVGFAENGKIGLQRVRELKPDAILLDLVMPETPGVARTLAQWDRGQFARPLEKWRQVFSEVFVPIVFEPYSLTCLGVTLWNMVYFKGKTN